MRIAVDAMGGDYAPAEVVRGSLNFARAFSETEIVLVGDEAALQSELAQCNDIPSNVVVKHASETIEMEEHPATAVRKKRDSSLVVAGLMVASGEADATLSAGNTGAAMAVAKLDIGLVPGTDRPAIATELPTLHSRTLLLDAGANVDVSPHLLLHFAVLGSLYSEKVLGRINPKVGLLNIGAEASKGNELTRAAYPLLAESGLNFVGNIEGKELFEHAADVVVCDGFSGNILLKTTEGAIEMMIEALMRQLTEQNPGEEVKAAVHRAIAALAAKHDYAETGGAPLLGVRGVSMIAHGRSKARAIENGILRAVRAVEGGYVDALEAKFAPEGAR